MEQAFTTSLISTLPMFSVVLPNFSLDVLPQQMWVDTNVALSNTPPTYVKTTNTNENPFRDAQGPQMAQIPLEICMEQDFVPKPLVTLSTSNTEILEQKPRARKTTTNTNPQGLGLMLSVF